jgi:hypothetical protein
MRRNAEFLYGLALMALSLVPSLAAAEDAAGRFTLSRRVHWGSAVLEPGEYKCAVENRGPSRVVFVRGIGGKPSYLFAASSISETGYSDTSRLSLAVRGDERFVQALSVGTLGETVYFKVPKEEVQESRMSSTALSASVR